MTLFLGSLELSWVSLTQPFIIHLIDLFLVEENTKEQEYIREKFFRLKTQKGLFNLNL